MSGYISNNKTKIVLIKERLKKSLGVTTTYDSKNDTSFSIDLSYNGKVDGIDSVLLFGILVELKEDKLMTDFASFFENHTLSMRFSIKPKKETHQYAIWHFDTENKMHNLMHPKYHFQYGGIAAKEQGLKCYNTPRITTLPIDYLIAIDFFLCNFFDEDIAMKVRRDNTYASALRTSQNSVLKGYYNLMHKYIAKQASTDEQAIVKKILPALTF